MYIQVLGSRIGFQRCFYNGELLFHDQTVSRKGDSFDHVNHFVPVYLWMPLCICMYYRSTAEIETRREVRSVAARS